MFRIVLLALAILLLLIFLLLALLLPRPVGRMQAAAALSASQPCSVSPTAKGGAASLQAMQHGRHVGQGNLLV